MKYCLLFFIIFLSACNCHDVYSKKVITQGSKKLIVIFQPLLHFSTKEMNLLKDRIEKFYPVAITITKEIPFPANTWYAPRERYRADATIDWLKKIKPDSARLILGLTEKDIS